MAAKRLGLLMPLAGERQIGARADAARRLSGCEGIAMADDDEHAMRF